MAEIHIPIELTNTESDNKKIYEFIDITTRVLKDVDRDFHFTYVPNSNQFDIKIANGEDIYKNLEEINFVYSTLKEENTDIFIASIRDSKQFHLV